MRSAGMSLKPSPVQMFMVQLRPSSRAGQEGIRIQALPRSTQNLRVSGLGGQSQRGALGMTKKRGVKVRALQSPGCLIGAELIQPKLRFVPIIKSIAHKIPAGHRQRGSFCVIYLAYSTALVSRIRLTLIWPGYSSSFSIFLAISRARMIMLSSVTSSGLTIMRTSRPA